MGLRSPAHLQFSRNGLAPSAIWHEMTSGCNANLITRQRVLWLEDMATEYLCLHLQIVWNAPFSFQQRNTKLIQRFQCEGSLICTLLQSVLRAQVYNSFGENHAVVHEIFNDLYVCIQDSSNMEESMMSFCSMRLKAGDVTVVLSCRTNQGLWNAIYSSESGYPSWKILSDLCP